MPTTSKGFEKIKSLDKALYILECVGDASDGAGVTEISAKLGINKATVSKMLSTMAIHHIVRKDRRTRRYYLGYSLLDLGTRFINSIDLRTDAQPHLKALETSVNEVINLAVCSNDEVIYIDKFEGTNSLRLHSRIGGRASLTCTSVGKIMFAFMSDEDRRRISRTATLEKRTSKSVSSWDELEEQCDEIRKKGYALDMEENVEGIICVGAPIFNYSGKAVGAVSISCPTVRCPQKRLMELKDKLLEACQKISADEGYHDKDKDKEDKA